MADATPLYRIRLSVRDEISDLSAGDKVLVAVSGGADSMALAAGLLLEAPSQAINPIAIVIDHDLQEDSAKVAEETKEKLIALGYKAVEIRKIEVEKRDGLEASARRARYEALDKYADAIGAVAIYLGHTKDDQAETVLLGLARGSGTRSLSGMAKRIDKYRRPLLAINRSETESACQELKIEYWRDPHNQALEFKRVRVRNKVLPIMESELGPGISDALSRSAKLLRDDADALDQWAAEVFDELDPKDIEIDQLAALPRAIRSRVIRKAIYLAGAPSGSISSEHLEPVEALITAWKGQGAVSLPGGVTVARISGRLSLS
jgi:tRNA(Ile)-lysidine synthase